MDKDSKIEIVLEPMLDTKKKITDQNPLHFPQGITHFTSNVKPILQIISSILVIIFILIIVLLHILNLSPAADNNLDTLKSLIKSLNSVALLPISHDSFEKKI